MNPKEERDAIQELTVDLKSSRMTRGDFVNKALAMGLSLATADMLLGAHPAFAMSKAERELRASGKVLQYWTPFAGPDGPHMKLMVDRYNAAHPGYYFNFVRVGGGYETKVTSAAISHTLPDVAAYRLDWIPDAVARGIFEPIDDIAKENHITASDFAPAVWQGGLQNGRRYSIPLDTHVFTFYYNKNLLRKAGVSNAPTNRSQFDAAAAAAKKAREIAMPVATATTLLISTLFWQAGGELFTPDRQKAAYDSAAGQKALGFLVDLIQKGYSPKGLTDASVPFITGKAVMWMDGIWQLTAVKGARFAYGAGPVPTLFEKRAVWSGSHQMVLPRRSRGSAERAAIGRFITYIVSNAAEWARGGQIPASKRVRDSAAFHAIHPQAEIAAEEPYVHFVDPFPGASQSYYPVMDKYGGLALTGKLSVKEALRQGVAESNKLLAAARARFSSGSQD
jgi:multiple sugar transport system substrate-binding protein